MACDKVKGKKAVCTCEASSTFLKYIIPFKTSTDLINIATGVIASNDVNVDSAVDTGKEIVRKIVNKALFEITLKRKIKQKHLQ